MIRRGVLALALAIPFAGVATIVSLNSPAPVMHGPRDRPLIALTFDADMTVSMFDRMRSGDVSGWYDPEIVRVLRATGTPATIFVTGLWAEMYPNVVRDLATDPLFELGNHSVDHSAFTSSCYGLRAVRSEAEKRRQVNEASSVLTSIAGVAPRHFRFPGGCYGGDDVRLVESLGERTVGWDVISGDSFDRNARSIVERVLVETRPGSIIVMHLNGAPNAPATAAAVRELIPALRARGFRFVTVRRLLA